MIELHCPGCHDVDCRGAEAAQLECWHVPVCVSRHEHALRGYFGQENVVMVDGEPAILAAVDDAE